MSIRNRFKCSQSTVLAVDGGIARGVRSSDDLAG
jgi:hypothetical protein